MYLVAVDDGLALLVRGHERGEGDETAPIGGGGGVVAAAVFVYFAFSQTIPVTHRRSFNVVPDRLLEWWNKNLADKIVAEVHGQGGRFLPERDPRAKAVHRVMKRLIPYTGIADRDWQVFVIQDDSTRHLTNNPPLPSFP